MRREGRTRSEAPSSNSDAISPDAVGSPRARKCTKCCADPGREKMAGRSESDYREVVFEREDKEPLRGFMRVDRGMVIRQRIWPAQRGSGRFFPAGVDRRLLLSELENAARGEADQKTDGTEENGTECQYSPLVSSAIENGCRRIVSKRKPLFRLGSQELEAELPAAHRRGPLSTGFLSSP